ncbi:hypothetical protein TNCT_77341 [Trichonephila clavata]|uniref:Uncharacterized protein n=1 Tax=Trichonephila clavata TaxID=2740835 RepID=A0A8X6JM37_TRICU|nr:hypothetical protein TNCT_77341 [Trichonephila clavata]
MWMGKWKSSLYLYQYRDRYSHFIFQELCLTAKPEAKTYLIVETPNFPLSTKRSLHVCLSLMFCHHPNVPSKKAKSNPFNESERKGEKDQETWK